MGTRTSHATNPLGTAALLAVIDIAPTPLWVIDADGTVALANRAALDTLGYRSAGEVIGAPSHDTLHEWRPDGSRYPSHSCPIMEERLSCTPDHEWFITRAGQPIPVTWSARPLGIEGSRLLSFCDATERVAAQHAVADEHDVRAAVEAAAVPSRTQLRARLLSHVHARFRDPDFTPTTLAAEVHLSLRSVQQLLAEAGRSPATEIRHKRLELASALITQGSSVSQACRSSGFTDPGTFNRAFRRRFGSSPSEWARRSG